MGLNPVRDTIVVASFPIPEAPSQVGITGTIVLTESHLACHTWPEEEYIRVELSSCAPVDPKQFEAILRSFFVPYQLEVAHYSWF